MNSKASVASHVPVLEGACLLQAGDRFTAASRRRDQVCCPPFCKILLWVFDPCEALTRAVLALALPESAPRT